MELSKLIPLAVGACALVGSAIGGASWVDNHYAKHSEIVRLAEDSEQARLETQLAIYRLELAQLRAKQAPSADDLDRIQYLVAVCAKIQERLDGIVKGS